VLTEHLTSLELWGLSLCFENNYRDIEMMRYNAIIATSDMIYHSNTISDFNELINYLIKPNSHLSFVLFINHNGIPTP